MISIIVATFNAERELPGLLANIRQQKDVKFELLIIDGASSDSTVAIINENSDLITSWLSECDAGIYDAWNKGVAMSKGDWLVFLGADDRFESEYALKSIDEASALLNDSTVLAFSIVAVVDPSTGRELFVQGEEELEYYRRLFLKEMLFPHTGALHRRSAVEASGGFDKEFKVSGDYDLALRMVQGKAYRIEKINRRFVRMSYGGVSTSPKTKYLAYWESILARSKNGHGIFSIRLVFRLARSLVSKSLFHMGIER